MGWRISNEVWKSVEDITEIYLQGCEKGIVECGRYIYINCVILKLYIFETYLEADDFKIVNEQVHDEILKIKNVEAAFVIYKINDVVNITSKSSEKINVQVIMAHLGGEGKFCKDSCEIKGKTIEEVKDMLLKAIDSFVG